MAAKVASAVSSLRFWDLVRMDAFEDIPSEYLPAEYGPSAEPAASEVASGPQKRTAEEKREIAARARRKAAGIT